MRNAPEVEFMQRVGGVINYDSSTNAMNVFRERMLLDICDGCMQSAYDRGGYTTLHLQDRVQPSSSGSRAIEVS